MNDLQYFICPNPSMYYHDLRPMQDDKSVLRNPHKGWHFHYLDNGMGFARYRDTLKPGDDLKWLPGLNHLYLRFDWNDIEPVEGEYRWDRLDEIIEKWSAYGYHFSLRLCTFEANRLNIPYSTPKWVFDAGAKGTVISRIAPGWLCDSGHDTPYTCVEPDYGDPIYLGKLRRFMEKYSEHFNGHPLIDFIDTGTFGTWGEGHTTSGSCRNYPFDVLKTHLDMHLRAFPDTQLILTTGMLTHCAHTDKADTQRLAEYCAAHGMGARSDSMYVGFHCEHFGCDMLQIPTAFELFWKTAPIDLESGHQTAVAAAGVWDGGFRMMETMKRVHASTTGFHGDPYVWYEKNAAVHNYLANRLGYWYFIEGYELPETAQGCNALMTLYVSNRGYAPAYRRYDLRVIARDGEGHETRLGGGDADCRGWMCGESAKVPIRLNTRSLEAGEYDLLLGLFDGERPVRFAMKEETQQENGCCLLGKITIEE